MLCNAACGKQQTTAPCTTVSTGQHFLQVRIVSETGAVLGSQAVQDAVVDKTSKVGTNMFVIEGTIGGGKRGASHTAASESQLAQGSGLV
jgi:hypothetical protein